MKIRILLMVIVTIFCTSNIALGEVLLDYSADTLPPPPWQFVNNGSGGISQDTVFVQDGVLHMIDEDPSSLSFGYLRRLPFDPGQIIEVEFRARVLSGESPSDERAPFSVWLYNGLVRADLSVGPDSITSLGPPSNRLLINKPIDGDNWHVYRYRVTSRGIEWWVDGTSIGTATVDMLIPHYTDSDLRINMFIAGVATVELDFLEVTVTVDPIPPMNQPPTVDAGSPQTVALPNNAQLEGTVTHDGLPGPTVTATWTKVSGSGSVTFNNPNSAYTTASFSATGTYVLRLTGDDGELSASADVTITVIPPRPPIPLALALRDRGLHDADGIPGGATVRLIYDEDRNITWLGDANFGAGSAFDDGANTTDGGMSWQNAVNWAASLTVGGFSNWRLPTTSQPDPSCAIQSPSGGVGQYCIGSELGHLFNAEMGGVWIDIDFLGLRLLQRWLLPFTNVQENGANHFDTGPIDVYWSGTEDSLSPSSHAWGFAWGTDNQNVFPKEEVLARFAWAVRDGDVSPVLSVLSQGLMSIVPPSSFDAVVGLFDGGGVFIPEVVLDGKPGTFWSVGPGNRQDDEIVLALGGNYLVSEIRYLPYSWTKCTQYEVYVSATNGDWGSPVASGTWANDITEKTASFPPTRGAYIRIRFLDNYCYVAELNVVGVADVGNSGNTAPSVNAGTNQTITLPNIASLDGTVSDDGHPPSPGSLTTTWSKVSGPGTVTFGNASSVDTTARFSAPGIYVLRLTANDGELTTSAEVTITVNPAPPPPPMNQAPSVNGGTPQIVTLPNAAILDGTVTDDGLPKPPGVVTTLWSKVSGPGVVTFGNPAAVDTTGSFTLPGTYVLRLTATDGALSTSADVIITVNNQSGRRQSSDVNGDGKADLVWRNSNGATAIWFMNGTAIASAGFPGGVPLAWQIAGVGDVNGDGKADVIWRHSTSGTVAIWLMNGVTITSVGFPGSAPPAWGIQAVGDVNGDGKADIVWRNTSSGAVSVWFMNGATITSAGFPPGVSLAWQVAGVGDVNGDGKADVIWRRGSSGTVAIWLMNGLTITSVGFPGTTSVAWKIEGVGDTNGDGKADLIWKNDTSGVVVIWLMNGATIASSGVLGGLGSSWKIAQVGDVDGNGKADLVWRNSLLSAVEVWIMNGLTITTMGSPGAVSTDWEIQ